MENKEEEHDAPELDPVDDDAEGSDESEDDDDDDDCNDFSAEATKSSPGISTPASHDIICGRGKMTSSHPGNRRFRELVLERKQAYQRARRRDDKTRITFELVQNFRDAGRYDARMIFVAGTIASRN